MLILLLIIALVGYVLSAVVILQHVAKNQLTHPAFNKIPATCAIISHALLIYSEISAADFHHINIALSLSSVAWFIALISLFRGLQPSNLLLQPVIYLFAALTSLLLIFAPASWGAYISMNLGLLAHIVLSLVAYGVLVLATLYAIQAAYVSNVLKQRKSSIIFNKLPPLLTVERYFFRLLSTGTLLLFLSLISGFIFLENMFAQHIAHKTILSLIAAFIYVIAYVTHRITGSRGKLMIALTVSGTILLTLAYFGSRFVKDILLS
ncbi:cytochrome c biogenesis protein CcsA [Idiomarina seosinensis]|uniref:cytochrome C assembly family protein n=1 Tax=Idiomarina seosinensis TaxID=281739 RepID=UPI00384C142E